MALDDVTERLERITTALTDAGVPFAIVGGQAVAIRVASRDPAAVRTTKDVDLLVERSDLPAIQAAARQTDMDDFEVLGTGMCLARHDPNPRKAVRLVWAGQKVRPEHPVAAPDVGERENSFPESRWPRCGSTCG